MAKAVAQILLVASLAGALSCESPELREIAISPEFEDYQIDAIIEAAEHWYSRAPELRVPIYVGEDRGFGAVVPSTKCGAGYVGFTDQSEGLRVVICQGLYAPTKAIAQHEFGHLFRGLPGHLGPGNVMAPEVSDYRQTLTVKDVAFIRREVSPVF